MLRSLGLPLVLAGLFAVATGAPVPKDFPRMFTFPTQAGTKWVYRMTNGAKEKSLTYIATSDKATVDGRKAVCIRLDDPKWASGGTVEASADGVFESAAFPGGAYYRPPICVLKLPHRSGNKWENTTRVVGRTMTERRTAFGPERVEVPSGKYYAIRVESEDTSDGGKKQRETQWYSDDVGLVKWVVRDEVWVLTEFQRGKE